MIMAAVSYIVKCLGIADVTNVRITQGSSSLAALPRASSSITSTWQPGREEDTVTTTSRNTRLTADECKEHDHDDHTVIMQVCRSTQ